MDRLNGPFRRFGRWRFFLGHGSCHIGLPNLLRILACDTEKEEAALHCDYGYCPEYRIRRGEFHRLVCGLSFGIGSLSLKPKNKLLKRTKSRCPVCLEACAGEVWKKTAMDATGREGYSQSADALSKASEPSTSGGMADSIGSRLNSAEIIVNAGGRLAGRLRFEDFTPRPVGIPIAPPKGTCSKINGEVCSVSEFMYVTQVQEFSEGQNSVPSGGPRSMQL